jgi:hypothetical protein
MDTICALALMQEETKSGKRKSALKSEHTFARAS